MLEDNIKKCLLKAVDNLFDQHGKKWGRDRVTNLKNDIINYYIKLGEQLISFTHKKDINNGANEDYNKDSYPVDLNEFLKSIREGISFDKYLRANAGIAENLFFTLRALWGICSSYKYWEETPEKLEKIIKEEFDYIIKLGSKDPYFPYKETKYWWSKDFKPVEITRTTSAALLALISYLEALYYAKNQLKRESFGGGDIESLISDVKDACYATANWLIETMIHEGHVPLSFKGQAGAKYHMLTHCFGWANIPTHVYKSLIEGDANRDTYSEHAVSMMGDPVSIYIDYLLDQDDALYDVRATTNVLISLMLLKRFILNLEDLEDAKTLKGDHQRESYLKNKIYEIREKIVDSFRKCRRIEGFCWSDLVCDNTFICLALILALDLDEKKLDKQKRLKYNGLIKTLVDDYFGEIDNHLSDIKEDLCILNGYIWAKELRGKDIRNLIDAMDHNLNMFQEPRGNATGKEIIFRPDFVGWAAASLANVIRVRTEGEIDGKHPKDFISSHEREGKLRHMGNETISRKGEIVKEKKVYTYRVHHENKNTLIVQKHDDKYCSTFTINVAPERDLSKRRQIKVIVDGETVVKDHLFRKTQNLKPNEIFEELHDWGPEIPPEMLLKVGDFLGENLDISDTRVDKYIEAKFGIKIAEIRAGMKESTRMKK